LRWRYTLQDGTTALSFEERKPGEKAIQALAIIDRHAEGGDAMQPIIDYSTGRIMRNTVTVTRNRERSGTQVLLHPILPLDGGHRL
jgi:hypothetical protein